MGKEKVILALLWVAAVIATSCKKDKEYCWTCTDQSGIDHEFCGKTEKEIEDMASNGWWDCRKK